MQFIPKPVSNIIMKTSNGQFISKPVSNIIMKTSNGTGCDGPKTESHEGANSPTGGYGSYKSTGNIEDSLSLFVCTDTTPGVCHT